MAARTKRTRPDPLSPDFGPPLARVYLVQGNEHVDVLRAVHRLTELALEGDPPPGSVVRLEGGSVTGQEIRAQAETLPFLTPKRVVVVANADALSADAQRNLAENLETLPETTCLLLEVRSGDSSRTVNQGLVKAVRNVGAVFEYKQMDARSDALPHRVEQLAAAQGKKMSRSTCQYLLQRTGTNLTLLESEIAKLAAYIEPGKEIRRQDVDAIIGKTVEESVFHLVDAVTEGRLAPALTVLSELLDRNEPPELILTLLLRQYRLLRQAKYLLEQEYRPTQWKSLPEDVQQLLPRDPNVGSSVGGRSWLADKLARQARRLSWEQLTAAPGLLLTADLQLKGADGQQRDRRVTLETLLCQLCPGRGRS